MVLHPVAFNKRMGSAIGGDRRRVGFAVVRLGPVKRREGTKQRLEKVADRKGVVPTLFWKTVGHEDFHENR